MIIGIIQQILQKIIACRCNLLLQQYYYQKTRDVTIAEEAGVS